MMETLSKLNPAAFFDSENDLLIDSQDMKTFRFISQGWEKLLGHSLNTLNSKSLSEFMPTEDYSRFCDVVKVIGGKTRISNFECQILDRNQNLRWLEWSFFYQDKTFHGLAEDITEKKEEEQKLKDVLERYQVVLSAINAGIWDWKNISEGLVYWSPKLFEILEYCPEKTIPTVEFFTSLMHPEDVAFVSTGITNAIANGDKQFVFEYRIKCGSGKYLWIQSLGIILRDENGVAQRMIGSITDVTQKKLIEFNLEEEKQKTIQSSKLATLGEMAAGLAHEVNNPLTIIFGYIRMLEEELLSPNISYERIHRHIGLVKIAAQRAAKIVTNLKDFARDGSGDPFTDIPASQMIAMVLDLCSERFKKNGISIDVTIGDDPIFYCRKIELSQVILNLLFNSFDAMDELDDRRVRINIHQMKNMVEMKIIDSGQGLRPEVAEKIFTPFFTTKKVGLGTGIGLSISQRIVLNHGGEIFYDPTCTNTCFVVRLPISPEQA